MSDYLILIPTEMTASRGVSRRAFLRSSSGVLVGAALTPALLAACTPPAPQTPSAASSASSTSAASAAARASGAAPAYPSYIPLTDKPTPDLPSTGPGIDDGFINYPANPVKVLPAEAPGRGGTLSYFGYGYYTPPTPV